MNLLCSGQLKIKCNKCGNIITIDCSDLPFKIVETHNREMGIEKCHSTGNKIDCPNCNNKISFKYDVWEYPEGVINLVNIEINGGTVIQECNLEMRE